VVQVARQCYDNSRGDGAANVSSVSVAFDDVVAEQEAVFQANWHALTALKQNVLRAVALGTGGLTTAESIAAFGLTSSGAATHAASALVDAGHLVKVRGARGYTYENPFFRRWVETETAADLGRGTT
jgi:hypothetical protein